MKVFILKNNHHIKFLIQKALYMKKDYIENNNEEAIRKFLEIELGGWALIHKTDNLTQVIFKCIIRLIAINYLFLINF
jgi:hypothetical protein